MSQPVIQVRDLGKRYRIRSLARQPYSNLREDLVNGIQHSGWSRSNSGKVLMELRRSPKIKRS